MNTLGANFIFKHHAGEIPASLGQLSSLLKLDLSWNKPSGEDGRFECIPAMETHSRLSPGMNNSLAYSRRESHLEVEGTSVDFPICCLYSVDFRSYPPGTREAWSPQGAHPSGQ